MVLGVVWDGGNFATVLSHIECACSLWGVRHFQTLINSMFTLSQLHTFTTVQSACSLHTLVLSEPGAHVHQKCRQGTLITTWWRPESQQARRCSLPWHCHCLCPIWFYCNIHMHGDFKAACHLAAFHPFIPRLVTEIAPPHWGLLLSQKHLYAPLQPLPAP